MSTALQLYPRQRCPACDATAAAQLCDLPLDAPPLWPFLDDFYHRRIPRAALVGLRYRVAECRACGLLYQRDVADAAGMARLYGEWLDDARSLAKKQRAGAALFRRYAREAALIARLFPQRRPEQIRVLELGSGWGYWGRMATAFGYAVSGLELDPRRAAHARALGVSLAASLDDIAAHSCDFIYANQVLEHLAEPADVLAELAARLAPQGRLLLRVPDARGLAARLRRDGWAADMQAIHPLEHINGFHRDSLLQLAARCALAPARAPLTLDCRTPRSLLNSLRREWRDRRHEPHLLLCKE